MKKATTMNKILFCSMLCAFSATTIAATTTLQLEHGWKEKDRRKTDTFKLIQKTDSGWQFEFKFGTIAGGNNINNTQSFDDMEGGSGGIVIQKGYALADGWGTITPIMEFGFSKNKSLFQPGIKYSYKLNSDWSTSIRYRYEWNKISQSERYKSANVSSGINYATSKILTENVEYIGTSNTGRHRFDWNISYSGFEAVQLSYTFNYYIGKNTNTSYSTAKTTISYVNNAGQTKTGNWTYLAPNEYKVYKGKKTDYEQQLKLTWNYSKQFKPYFEIDDVSRDKETSGRQAKYKIGFNYIF